MKNTDFRFPYTDYLMPSGTSIGVHVVHLSFLWNIYKNRSLQRTATERIIFVPEKQKSGMCRIKSIWGMYVLPVGLTSIKKSQEKSHGQNLAIFLRFGKIFEL